MNRFSIALAFCTLLSLCGESRAHEPLPVRAVAILEQHCVRCHNAEKERGGLNLSTRAALLQGGAHDDAIQLGAPETSALLLKAQSGTMPPERDGRRLNARELQTLFEWIRAGAEWPESSDHVQPPPPVPATTPSKSLDVSGCALRKHGVWLRRRR